MTQTLKKYAEIVVNIPINKKFHYGIPEELEDRIAVGKMVTVPFGSRTLTGYCVGFTDQPDVAKVKDIKLVIDDEPSIDEGMLKISKWISEYYRCSWGEAVAAVLPGSVKKSIKAKQVKIVRLAGEFSEIRDEIERIRKKISCPGKSFGGID